MKEKHNSKWRSVYIVILLFLALIAIYSISALISGYVKPTNAQSSSSLINSRPQWEAGILSNIDSISNPGSIKIDNKSGTEIDLSGKTITSIPDLNKGYVTDSNCSTEWVKDGWPFEGDGYWAIDLGQVYNNISIQASFGNYPASNWLVSDNGTDWNSLAVIVDDSPVCGGNPANFKNSGVFNARYIKWNVPGPAPSGQFKDLRVIYYSATATHTSAATQITDTNLYQWQTFTATYTKPANTDVSFKFRTSTDAATWTAWTASQTPASGTPLTISALVTSSTGPPGGETFYKYIQVETTLTSTDGVANPTVSDYTVAFHNNVAPNKPTAATAVIAP